MDLPRLKTARIALIAVLASCGVAARAQEAPHREWRTGFAWNGRFWKAAMPLVKTGFLVGYEQALVYTGLVTGVEYSKSEEFKRQLYPALTIDEVESAVDRFYETPENGPIPVSDSLRIIAARANGGSADEIEKLTDASRKSAAAILAIEHK